MRKQLFLLAFVLILQSSLKAQTTIVVENKTNQQRSELISISAEQLGVKPRTKLIVRDVFDIEQPTQWTYDGRLLMSVYVKPNDKATFTIDTMLYDGHAALAVVTIEAHDPAYTFPHDYGFIPEIVCDAEGNALEIDLDERTYDGTGTPPVL